MNILTSLLTGGFLAGYRTYIVGWLIVAQAVASWAMGDMTLPALLEQLPEILAGLGFNTVRAAITAKE
jgi:hypothetical protein